MITHADLPHELNLASWFVDRNVEEGRGDRTALIGATGPTTYAELARLVNRYGNLLRELGVRAQDRVLLVLADSVDFVALWYGAQKIGAVTAEAYTFLQPKDYAYYLEYTDAAVVVADETTQDAIRQVAGERQVLVVDESFGQRLGSSPDELEPAPTTKDDIALWKFTTGSTGQPKGAVHPVHSPVLSHEWYARGVLGIREDDVVLPGAEALLRVRARPDRALPVRRRRRGDRLPGALDAGADLRADRRAPADDPRQRSDDDGADDRLGQTWPVPGTGHVLFADVHVGRRGAAARSARPLARHVRRRGARRDRLVRAVPHLHLEPARPGAAGVDRRARAGLRGRARRDRRAARHGRHGALYYWGDEEKTKRTFDGDTVHTGDLFERDDDGFFWYRGRVDDLIKVGGIWVAPAEIEHCLVGHPDVVECAVVGAARNGLTIPRAYVVVRQPVEEQALQDFVRERLSPHKYPREVVFVDDLPKTPSGKLDRKALAA